MVSEANERFALLKDHYVKDLQRALVCMIIIITPDLPSLSYSMLAVKDFSLLMLAFLEYLKTVLSEGIYWVNLVV